jgi:hypothetical protein
MALMTRIVTTTNVNQAYVPQAANDRLLILSGGRQWNFEIDSSVGRTPNRLIDAARVRHSAASEIPSSSSPHEPVAIARYDKAAK